MERILIDQKTMNPGFFLHPLLSGGTFISKLGVTLG